MNVKSAQIDGKSAMVNYMLRCDVAYFEKLDMLDYPL